LRTFRRDEATDSRPHGLFKASRRCSWSDGTFVDVKRHGGSDGAADPSDPRIVKVKGAQAGWFVALAPEGVGYRSAEVAR
jgi:hypothetical protein